MGEFGWPSGLKIDLGGHPWRCHRIAPRCGVRRLRRGALGLGIEVVAEGIEHRADWVFSLSKGAVVGHGYFISPPLAPNAFEARRLDWM